MRAGVGAGSKSSYRACYIGLAKMLLGRGEETEAHIQEALRLSPRDTLTFRWLPFGAVAKLQLGADTEAVACYVAASRPTAVTL